MSDDNKAFVEGLSELRTSLESKGAESAEAKAKQDTIIKELGDAQAASQKSFEAEQAKGKELESTVADMKGKMDALYKSGSRKGFGNGASEADETYRKYAGEMDNFLRKGIEPSNEILTEIAQEMAHKSLVTQDEDVVKAAAALIKSDSSKGHLLFPGHRKDYVTGINPDGGYFVNPDARTDFSVTREFETSPVRAVARVITTTSNEVEIIIDDNESSSGGWVTEMATRGDTDGAQVGVLSIVAHEQFAQPKVTQKMLDDSSINIEQFITMKTNDILIRTENTAFVSGDGAAKPKGFLAYNAWAVNGTYERDAIEQIDSGISAAIAADSIVALQTSLKGSYQPSAIFMMKRATWGEVMKLKDGEGRYLLNFELLPDGAGLRLLGKQVLFADDMATISADSLSIAYGDFSQGYTIVDRFGIRVLRDALTEKPFTKFYTTKRVGGAVTNYEAIKLLKLAE